MGHRPGEGAAAQALRGTAAVCSRITVSISVFDVIFLLKLEPPRMWFLNVFQISSCNITLSKRWPGQRQYTNARGLYSISKALVVVCGISWNKSPTKTTKNTMAVPKLFGKHHRDNLNMAKWRLQLDHVWINIGDMGSMVVTCFCELDTFGKGQMKGPSWLHSQNADSAKRPCWIYLSNTLWISRLLLDGREGCSIK